MDVQFVMFWIFAVVALFSAVMVVTRRNPVHSALYLLVTFFSVAAIYVVLQAEFLAVVQVLVYAGGILVLFLFVILLVDVRREPGIRRFGPGHLLAAVALTALVALPMGIYFLGAPQDAVGDTMVLRQDGGNLETVAMSLFRYYLLPFEVVSILLLVALVGAVVLARSKV